MPHVNPVLPNDGESADAGDISGPFLELLAVFNGHIGADNLEEGTIPDALGDSAIDTAKIANSAVTTTKINDGAITPQKVAPAVIVANETDNAVTPQLSSRMFIVTALNDTTNIAPPSGTPYDGQPLTLRIKTNEVAHTLIWASIYRGVNVTLPTVTSPSKFFYATMLYNLPDTKWDVLSIIRQP